MIVSIYEDQFTSFSTNGCGCCSMKINPDVEYWKQQQEWDMIDESPEKIAQTQKEMLMEHLKSNVTVLKRACELLNLDLQTLLEDGKQST